MKQYIFTIVAALAGTCVTIASDNNVTGDTLVNVTIPSTLIITESPQGISLNITDIENDTTTTLLIADYKADATISVDQHTSRFQAFTSDGCAIGLKTSSKWEVISGGFNIGLVKALDQPDGLDLQWAKSFEISWLNTIAVRYSHKSTAISLGVGLDWRNYNTTTQNHFMIPDDNTGISVMPYPDGVTPGNSRIKIFSLGFPLLYTQKIPGTTLSITAGGIFNINTHASLKTIYKNESGNKIEEYSEGISRRKVSFDIYGSIHLYKGVGIYARYSPQSVLSGVSVPKFQPLSVGISLFM